MRPRLLILENEDAPGDETCSLSSLVEHQVETVAEVRICTAPIESPFLHLNGCHGIIVGGSSASVNEDKNKPWIRREIEFLREAVKRGIPLLGLCFGHQLIAKTLGASIEGMGWENYGFAEVRNLRTDALFEGLGSHFIAPVYHYERVAILPKCLKPIASSEGVPYMGFRCARKPIWGVQFHPEITVEVCGQRGEFPEAWRSPSNFENVRAQEVLLNFARLLKRT